MEAWQWIAVILAGASALYVTGLIVWGVFDVLREDRLDQLTRALWVLLLFVLPVFGILAWLYAKPRIVGTPNSVRLKKAL
ncbi:PLDc N-terminal domain-containing protein [Paenarthrobacter sp. GOM3]|uniref:PLDc N-terminal domain-containing protein n=1 Tax=Paenarthrobacter sp. GOM3 TaxID=2782567 RepID=UPI001BA9ED8B|nr:PLDc N-terminal domain-containing protein [Paenarthrobacter sp. GOM3]WOH19782.1 PLDc N-terminal domain-containing protein [Paenarthrobacter sp. GOM3]